MNPANWQHRLLEKSKSAREAYSSQQLDFEFTGEALEAAYGYCDRLTSIHSKSFHLASAMLPPEKRKATRALYAFCRTSDDIIDNPIRFNENAAEDWRARALVGAPLANDPVSFAWLHARKSFEIPVGYAHQLIDGVAADLTKQRYLNFDELAEYCYGVASTVGLMSMCIVGYRDEEAVPHAIKLGVALQLINILRDISEDYRMGRVYLPQDEMRSFNVSELHIRDGINDENWRAFMKFQIERVHQLYNESWRGVNYLHPSGRMAIAAALLFYKGILNKIEQNNYDVFSQRAALSGWGKIKMIPRIWFENSFQTAQSFNISSK